MKEREDCLNNLVEKMLATVTFDEIDFEFKDYLKTCGEPEVYLLQEWKHKLKLLHGCLLLLLLLKCLG
jgi:hypothetical protein